MLSYAPHSRSAGPELSQSRLLHSGLSITADPARIQAFLEPSDPSLPIHSGPVAPILSLAPQPRPDGPRDLATVRCPPVLHGRCPPFRSFARLRSTTPSFARLPLRSDCFLCIARQSTAARSHHDCALRDKLAIAARSHHDYAQLIPARLGPAVPSGHDNTAPVLPEPCFRVLSGSAVPLHRFPHRLSRLLSGAIQCWRTHALRGRSVRPTLRSSAESPRASSPRRGTDRGSDP